MQNFSFERKNSHLRKRFHCPVHQNLFDFIVDIEQVLPKLLQDKQLAAMNCNKCKQTESCSGTWEFWHPKKRKKKFNVNIFPSSEYIQDQKKRNFLVDL